MGPDGAVVFAPVLDQNFGFSKRCEDLAVQKLAPLSFEIRPGSILSVLTRSGRSHSDTLTAINSGPLSERRCSGGPCATKRSARH